MHLDLQVAPVVAFRFSIHRCPAVRDSDYAVSVFGIITNDIGLFCIHVQLHCSIRACMLAYVHSPAGHVANGLASLLCMCISQSKTIAKRNKHETFVAQAPCAQHMVRGWPHGS